MYCDGRMDGDLCEMDCFVGTYGWVCSVYFILEEFPFK